MSYHVLKRGEIIPMDTGRLFPPDIKQLQRQLIKSSGTQLARHPTAYTWDLMAVEQQLIPVILTCC